RTPQQRSLQPAPWRLVAVATVLVLAAAALIGRLAYLQIGLHGTYQIEATDEHFDRAVVPAHRGSLLDSNGFPLATSIDTYEIDVDRKVWRNTQIAQRGVALLAQALGKSPDEIAARVGDGESGPARIATDLDYETGRKIIALGIPGVQAQVTSH